MQQAVGDLAVRMPWAEGPTPVLHRPLYTRAAWRTVARVYHMDLRNRVVDGLEEGPEEALEGHTCLVCLEGSSVVGAVHMRQTPRKV